MGTRKSIRRVRIDILVPTENGTRVTLTGDSRTMTAESLDRYEKLCNALLRRIARHFREQQQAKAAGVTPDAARAAHSPQPEKK